jgi:hypothetical protein
VVEVVEPDPPQLGLLQQLVEDPVPEIVGVKRPPLSVQSTHSVEIFERLGTVGEPDNVRAELSSFLP